MGATERLYYNDPHLTEFEARVTAVTERVSGWVAVTLDRTAFYPTGGGQPFDTGRLTIPANMTGHPAVSIPCGLSATGLPIGLQVYGPRHREALLLDLARIAERQRPWPLVAPGAPV